MEADITNIAFCPYGIFVYATPENPDQTTVGHRAMPEETMAEVSAAELHRIQRMAFRRFFLRPRRVAAILRDFPLSRLALARLGLAMTRKLITSG